MKARFAIPCTAMILAMLATSPAAAQDVQTEASDADNGEIIVTARRVNESIQNTPVSVTAITGEALQRQNVFDVSQLPAGPGVILDRDTAFPNSGAFSIRGISLDDKEPTNDPAVGVMVNDIYLARTYGAVLDLIDVENVQVLRGPQGTLFGRNTMAGLITVRTRRPGDAFAMRAQASYGSWNALDLRGAVDIPLSGDRAGLSIAAQYRRSDGYFENLAPLGPDVGGTASATVRGTLVVRPTDSLTMTLIGDYTDEDNEPFAGNPFVLPFQVLARPAFQPFIEPRTSSPDRVYQNGRGPNDGEYYGASLELVQDLGSVDLTSLTGYRDSANDVVSDFDRTGTTFLHTRERTNQWQFSQELRATTKFDGAFNLVAGLYYFETRVRVDRNDELDQCMVQTLLGFPCVSLVNFFTPVAPGQALIRNDGFYRQNAKSWSAYGQAFIDLGGSVRATIGGRYTSERKDFTIEPADDDLANRIIGIPDPTVSDSKKFKNFSPRVGLDFQVQPNILLYGSFARGFRSGGYNGRAGSVTSIGPYGDEQVDSFELGLKSDLLDRKLRFNVAAFLNNYDDMQLAVFRSTGFGQETVVTNAGKARIGGVEIEAVAKLTQAFRISADLAWTDSKYERFVADLDGDGVETDNSSLRVRRTPKWKSRVAADLTIPVGAGDVDANLTWNYSSSYETIVQNFAFGRRPSASEFDANLRYQPNDKWRIAVFARNIFDKRFVRVGTPVGPFFSFQNSNAPRSVGVTISVNVE
jgi:iron complex outermembrane recepter protein